MHGLIALWTHTLAATAFAGVLIWRVVGTERRSSQGLMLGALAITASWAWLAGTNPGSALAFYSEIARNLIWIALLYVMSNASGERQHGVKMVYGAVGAAIGVQLFVTYFEAFNPTPALTDTGNLLRITVAAGALILVHNFYAQSSPATRSHLRFTMIGLAVMWLYDLNFYTIAYLSGGSSGLLDEWRGLVMLLLSPLFALGAHEDKGLRIRLSRSASFQSLSILAICAYFAVMVIVSSVLRGSASAWLTNATVVILATLTVAAMVIFPSGRARGWLKVKIAKHFFEHRYDYRSEWLRFTATIGQSDKGDAPLSDRVIMAFADILDSPGGVLLTTDAGQAMVTATWHWPGDLPGSGDLEDWAGFWNAIQASGRIIEIDPIRGGYAGPVDRAIDLPPWMVEDDCAWAAVPLIHEQRVLGLVVLAAPDFRRSLDWEDFDLLRTAGRQAASSLADAHSQEALATAQRFEEFNRRFAFILHDIKNLVSQLSLVARNAERHADNPEFRADMVATLKSSVNKMNDLLARLAPQGTPRVQQLETRALHPILADIIESLRGRREVSLSDDAGLAAAIDPSAFEHALRNLIQNGIEASPEGTPVEVSLSARSDQIVITVADQGCGMDGDFVRNRLFQPFASTKSNGFGIGAFEARSLIAAMGGRLAVESQPGQGTAFTIFLPMATPIEASERKRA